MHPVITVTLLISGLIALIGTDTPPPFPENQIIESAKLEPNPPTIFKVQSFQGLNWKNILLPPGRDPYLKLNGVPGAKGPPLKPIPVEVEPDDVERKKRTVVPARPMRAYFKSRQTPVKCRHRPF